MKNRIRNKRYIVMFSDEEMKQIYQKMEQFGIKNFSAFARRMLLGGLVVNTDMTSFEEAAPSIEMECEKINSLAKRINVTNKIGHEDIEQATKSQEAIKNMLEKIKAELE